MSQIVNAHSGVPKAISWHPKYFEILHNRQSKIQYNTHKIESKNSKLILVINILQYFEDNCKSLSCNLNFANSEHLNNIEYLKIKKLPKN